MINENMINQNDVHNTYNHIPIVTNYSIRIAQEIEINRETLRNLRISSATNICITFLITIGVGIIGYYVIFLLGHLNQENTNNYSY